MTDVSYRGFRKTDIPALSKMIEDTWDFKSFAGCKWGLLCSEIYLRYCVSNSTGTLVAELDGKPVGLVLWTSRRGEHRPLGAGGRLRAIPLSLTRQGRASLGFMTAYEDTFEEMIERSGTEFDSEILLYIVDPDMRGKGIGGRLFREAVESLRGDRCRNMCLCTDGDCSFTIYDRFGMQRMGSVTKDFQVGKVSEKLTMYLYSMTL